MGRVLGCWGLGLGVLDQVVLVIYVILKSTEYK